MLRFSFVLSCQHAPGHYIESFSNQFYYLRHILMTTPTSAQQQAAAPILADDGDASAAAVRLGSNDSNGNSNHYPLHDVVNPHPHDVLCGRGGATNSHIGNSHWRTLVTTNKELYVTLPKRQKQLLSKSIVHAVRSQNPPGRFLQKDFSTGLWFDVGDVKAQEKTSQALREGAPLLRVKLKNTSPDAESTNSSINEHSEAVKAPEKPVDPPPPPAVAPSPSINYNNNNNHSSNNIKIHHPAIPSVPPPPPPIHAAQGPVVVVADQTRINSNPPPSTTAIHHKHAASSAAAANHDIDVLVPPPPSMLDPTGEFSLGTISIPEPSEVGGLENGFSFGSVMSDGGPVQEELSRYAAASSNTASCMNGTTVQFIGSPPSSNYPHQQHQHHSQHVDQPSSRPVQRDSLADAGGRLIMPPTALQANELSFGSIIMTDAEQSRLETNMQQQQQQQQQCNNSNDAQPLHSSYDRFGRAGDDAMIQPVDGGLEPAGFSAGSMMSIGTINTNLEYAGMSLGSTISPVDGGLEAIGTSFGSMTIGGGPNSMNTSGHNQLLPAVAERSRPTLPPQPPPVPMDGVPTTFLRQKRSKGNLLECSDTESDDDEQSAQASAAQKSAEWEKLKATFESQMAGGAYTSATVPPSFNPIATSSAARAQRKIAAAEPSQQPLVLNIPETGFVRDLSQMSACSVGDFQDEHHHNPAENNSMQFSAAPGGYGEKPPSLPLPPPPQESSLTRTESGELRAFEMTLLNRGSSLAGEEFQVPRQPE
jgi:hypothetical protein